MSAIFVSFARRGQAADLQALEAVLAASRDRAVDGQQVWLRGCVALAHQHFHVTPEEVGESQPLEHGSLVIVADARLDNRPELLPLLELPRDSSLSDAALLLRSYLRWGETCVDFLLGDFAFAIWDPEREQLFAARDGMGARGLCFFRSEELFLLASEVRQLLAHPKVPRRMHEGKMADFLVDAWDEHGESFWQEIHYCPPGHWLRVTADRFELHRFWRPDPELRIRYRDDREYAECFLEVASKAVRCRLRSTGPVALSLSGGLDSTTVAAIAAPALTDQGRGSLRSFTYVFDELQTCDERVWVEELVQSYGLEPTYLPGDGCWPLRNFEEWPGDIGFVFSDPYAWLALRVADAAGQSGCRVLLTGHFGDMLFLGGAYWAADLLREKRWGPLLTEVRARRSLVSPRADLFSHGLAQLLPRAWWSRFRRRPPAMIETVFAPSFVTRTDLEQRLVRDRRWMLYSRPGQWARVRGLVSSANPEGAMAARSWFARRGVERLDPLADRRLVELSLAFPADQLGRPGRPRRVLRNAVAELLPESIRERRDKTGFLPLFDRGMRERELGTVREILRDPEILRREIVRRDWLEEQLAPDAEWPDYGNALWKCLSLEIWLQRYG